MKEWTLSIIIIMDNVKDLRAYDTNGGEEGLTRGLEGKN
jgi:hypothetical protein